MIRGTSSVSVLVQAILRKDDKAVLLLVESGVDVNFRVNQKALIPPLIYAVHIGNLSMVRLLVDAKAQLDPASRFAPQSLNQVCLHHVYFRGGVKTALQYAIDTNKMEIAEFLKCSSSFGHAAAPDVALEQPASDE